MFARRFLRPSCLLGACASAGFFATGTEHVVCDEKSTATLFLNRKIASEIKKQYGTPTYVYDETALRTQANAALSFPHKYGLTVRYAMKACPNAEILKLFNAQGLHFDASSGYEVLRAIRAGIPPHKICLSSQEFPEFFSDLYAMGIEFNACSLDQLEQFGKLFPGRSCGIRVNPGLGSGGTAKTNVGGPASSFGVWHEQLHRAKEIIAKYNLKVTRIHTHIGSGSDPEIWKHVASLSLNIVRSFPEVTTLNLGGGFKVARVESEKSTNMQEVGRVVMQKFNDFEKETGRKLSLEIEPGTFLVANAGSLLCTVKDIVSTGNDGYTFIKLDTGMTEVLRPSLYGAQHPITVLNDATSKSEYLAVGHCCESGDLFTCAPGEPDKLAPRPMNKVTIGDLVNIGGTGAYCSSMSTKNYNSFPEAAEVLLSNGQIHLIRRRQALDQIIQNEVAISREK